MSLLDSLEFFVTGNYRVTRSTNKGYDAQGRVIAPVIGTFFVSGSSQPLSARELLILPEAQRAEETRWFYTATELRTRAPSWDPDVIAIPNEQNIVENWTVRKMERWDYLEETFWRCQISRTSVP